MTKTTNGVSGWDLLLASAPVAPPTHARVTRGGDRRLCDGALAEASYLSVEAAEDEDCDVTCRACLDVIREADAEAEDEARLAVSGTV